MTDQNADKKCQVGEFFLEYIVVGFIVDIEFLCHDSVDLRCIGSPNILLKIFLDKF